MIAFFMAKEFLNAQIAQSMSVAIANDLLFPSGRQKHKDRRDCREGPFEKVISPVFTISI
jgi:hypothetical protein